jgi:hypothetical protein
LSGQPAGVSIDGATGLITVSETLDVNTYVFIILAENGIIPGAAQSFALTVLPPLSNIDIETVTNGTNEVYWNFNNNIITVNNGANLEITGTVNNGRRIVVAANATAIITLKDASITIPNSPQYLSPLSLNSGARLTLIIEGENYLKAADSSSGIQVPSGTSLTIDGTGSLTAAGTSGAGIGGSNQNSTCGTVTIEGGTITSIGDRWGAGIGGGFYDGGGGTITINGGTVTAIGGTNPGTGGGGAGIGGGGVR